MSSSLSPILVIVLDGWGINPRQEGNILRMHQVIDRYITEGEGRP